MDIIFVSIAFLILFGVAYAHYCQKITMNYWICILLILRMCTGLVQNVFISTPDIYSKDTDIIWGFYSYIAIDCLIYLIIKVSH